MFFNDWFGPARVLIVGALFYPALILILRTSGKRTLSKWNAFDLIVTIALGSTLASALLARDVALAEGIAALLLLIALQFIVTWLSIRSPWFARAIKSSPELLVENGKMLDETMRRNRVTKGEVMAAVRSSGTGSMDAVRALVLETDGSFSLIAKDRAGDMSAVADVYSAPRSNGMEARS